MLENIKFRMINTDYKYEIDMWKTIKAKKLTTSPTLIAYLEKADWNTEDGHPKQLSTCERFRRMLSQHPQNISFKFNEKTHQLKLMTPSVKPNIWEIIVLRFPTPFRRMFSAETPRLPPFTMETTEPQKSDCSGSMKNYVSSDDVLTEFEIEETTDMVKKWIKNKWFVPTNAHAIILLDSSSDSDTSEKDRLLVRRLKYLKPKRSEKKTPPMSPLAFPLPATPSPPPMNRPVPRKVDKYDLFCDDSATDHDSENSLTL